MQHKMKILLLFLFSIVVHAEVGRELTYKQVSEFVQVVKRSGRINKWNVIISVTPPEREVGTIVTVEKRRSGEFSLSWFLADIGKMPPPDIKSIRYQKISETILLGDVRYKTIERVETIKIPLNSWGGRILLDGERYKLEIDSLETQTIFNFSNISFDDKTLVIKEWIDSLISIHPSVRK